MKIKEWTGKQPNVFRHWFCVCNFFDQLIEPLSWSKTNRKITARARNAVTKRQFLSSNHNVQLLKLNWLPNSYSAVIWYVALKWFPIVSMLLFQSDLKLMASIKEIWTQTWQTKPSQYCNLQLSVILKFLWELTDNHYRTFNSMNIFPIGVKTRYFWRYSIGNDIECSVK